VVNNKNRNSVSEKARIKAIKQNGYTICFIKNPSLEALLFAFRSKEAEEHSGLKQYIINKMKELKFLI
jgi:hypothetical protein